MKLIKWLIFITNRHRIWQVANLIEDIKGKSKRLAYTTL
jgi:hypothetical protein